jgi:hypothetical protein
MKLIEYAYEIVIVCGAVWAILRPKLNEIIREVKPNGGSSIKDRVVRLEKKIDRIEHRLGTRPNDEEDYDDMSGRDGN